MLLPAQTILSARRQACMQWNEHELLVDHHLEPLHVKYKYTTNTGQVTETDAISA